MTKQFVLFQQKHLSSKSFSTGRNNYINAAILLQS